MGNEEKILIGTSGYSYPDWKERFYPKNIRQNMMFSYYARYFRTVEINTSYYKIPDEKLINHLLSVAKEGYDFVFKAPKEFTHERDSFGNACSVFCERLMPICKKKMLGTILLQFPYFFKYNEDSLKHLEKLRECVPFPLHAEFRNSEWLRDNVVDFLTELDIGFVNVDEPKLPKLLPQTNIATTDIGYFRFHGRNAAHWWNSEQAYMRYDYLYSEDELSEWVSKIKESAGKLKKTYVFMNNHYQAKAVRNASAIGKMLGVFKEDVLMQKKGKNKSLLDF